MANRCTLSSVFEELATAIDELQVPAEGRALAAAIALRDRLDARIGEAVARFDAAGAWQADGATSMTAWLADRGRMSRSRAVRESSSATKLAQLPVTTAAFRDGVLSNGQVEAITANLSSTTVGLFATHEAELVPALADLPPADVATAMRTWRSHATDEPSPAPEARQSLHLSRLFDDRWRLDGDLSPEAGELLAAALRLAETGDVEGERLRLAAERRADALADVCRHFLDHQQVRRGGRHRPHLNVIVDPDRGDTGVTPGGTVLDHPTVTRLLCDSSLHRVVMHRRSAILDYGTATRTVPAPLWSALVVRDRHCRFPGCDRPAAWCEAHHVRHWLHGGPTEPGNLVLMCSRHHHLLHGPGWHAKLLPDATVAVTGPGGRVTSSRPPPSRLAV